MGYLEQFARNRKGKGKTEVLTARLPESLYSEFKTYCDELGLSISESVCLLVEYELNNNRNKTNTEDDIIADEDIQTVVEENTKEKRTTSEANTKRFTLKDWVVDGELPCPLCNQWVTYANFSRHAKQHGSNSHEIFTNEENLKRVNEMIEDLKAIQKLNQ